MGELERMFKKYVILFILTIVSVAFPISFDHYTQFKDSLFSIVNEPDVQKRDSLVRLFWNDLKDANQIPFTSGDSAAFLYFGNASSVRWVGDFNRWGTDPTGYGANLNQTNLWFWEDSFPPDARLDYKIILNGSDWILDPANPFYQWGGFGPNSELRMPEYQVPPETIRDPEAPPGTVLPWTTIYSTNLGYDVKYRVYLPAGYDTLTALPVIYTTDGDEYSDDRLGSMIIVLDNLIYWKTIRPIIAVFISPIDPHNNSSNRRMSEYNLNSSFASFVAKELVPVIDSTYKTSPHADDRAILGTSLGGLNSAYFGQYLSDLFHLIGIQSPAFSYNSTIYNMYQDSVLKPLKIYMTTGVINDTEESARQMKSILENKGYTFGYKEVNQSHSWGNWRGLLDDILIYFWGNSINDIEEKFYHPEVSDFKIISNYPNPFNSTVHIQFYLPRVSFVKFTLFDMQGRKLFSKNLGKFNQGSHDIALNNSIFSRLPSGIYFYELRLNQQICLRDKIIFLK